MKAIQCGELVNAKNESEDIMRDRLQLLCGSDVSILGVRLFLILHTGDTVNDSQLLASFAAFQKEYGYDMYPPSSDAG